MRRSAGIRAEVTPVVANVSTAGGAKIMSTRRILVPLPGSVDQTGEIDMALSATKALGAHVEALFISQPPPVARGGVSVSEYGGRTAAVAPNWYAEERDRTVRDARERFARACAAGSRYPAPIGERRARRTAGCILARSRGAVRGNRRAAGRCF